jgi:hypothetical protein
MKCEEVHRILPDVTEGGEDRELQAHLDSCSACSDLVSDLSVIASSAKQLAASDEPPARVWVNIANQLRAEGIIREPEPVPARPQRVPTHASRWNAWWLAPIAAAILAAGASQLSHKATLPATQQTAQQSTVQTAQPQQVPPRSGQQVAQSGATSKAVTKQQPEQQAANQPIAEPPVSLAGGLEDQAGMSAPAGGDDDQFLIQVSESAPSMRATYEKQLQAVNAEILETQEYIRRHPGDLDARQHLMETFQQKAMLYQMALDRIQ